jgi:hypothetical protein
MLAVIHWLCLDARHVNPRFVVVGVDLGSHLQLQRPREVGAAEFRLELGTLEFERAAELRDRIRDIESWLLTAG